MNKIVGITCILPARNEAGHLEEVLNHVLSVDEIIDVVIVEGGSSDTTWAVAQMLAAKHSKRVSAIKQVGKGKFNAVREAAEFAKAPFILIWDADGTVPQPCTVKVIRSAMLSGNPTIGDRLRGQIDTGAMQKANYLGNWFFAFLWAPILATRPTDMLCGTKIIPKSVLTEIPKWMIRTDPYGDFSFVATSRLQGWKIETVVVDYQARKYGSTNIHRWSGGVKLLQVTFGVYFWFLFVRKKV